MIIVNFSTEGYRRGQERLQNSLNGHKCLMYSSYEAIGSPTHQESPYQFKLHTIEKGFQRDNDVLWADSSFWLVGDLGKVQKIIETDGYYFEEAGHWVGDWCNQFTRDYFNLTPEESKVPGGFYMFSAGFVGLSKSSPIAMEFFRQWKASAEAGCFSGSMSDHRHDQTAGSIIAHRLGMKIHTGGSNIAYVGPGYEEPKPGVVFLLQGMA